jgi:hypothetical protein
MAIDEKGDQNSGDLSMKVLKTLNVTAWWKKVQGRNSWKAVIRRTRLAKGCSTEAEQKKLAASFSFPRRDRRIRLRVI